MDIFLQEQRQTAIILYNVHMRAHLTCVSYKFSVIINRHSPPTAARRFSRRPVDWEQTSHSTLFFFSTLPRLFACATVYTGVLELWFGLPVLVQTLNQTELSQTQAPRHALRWGETTFRLDSVQYFHKGGSVGSTGGCVTVWLVDVPGTKSTFFFREGRGPCD